METNEFVLESIDKIDELAKILLATYEGYKVFILEGDLGAGKTTLTQAFCRILDAEDEVVSPTYTIINEYHTKDDQTIYHADFYRLDTLEEATETGIEDYLFSGQYCFIEWPQILKPILPLKFVKLVIQNLPEPAKNGRKIIAKAYA